MKKVLITMGALAIALATAQASDAACCGYGNYYGATSPIYSSYNYNYRNGNCCGCAAPVYSYYVPLASRCCTQAPSCCGCAAPMNNCGCDCGCGCCKKKGYFFW